MTTQQPAIGQAKHQAQRLLLPAAVLLLAGLGYAVAKHIDASDPAAGPDLAGVVRYHERAPLQGFTLHDQHGQPLDAKSLQENWWFLVFGYTHCPDVCASNLLQLASVNQAIGLTPGIATQPRYVFISVDPARDGNLELAAYVEHFGKNFAGATGDPEQIRELERQVDAVHQLGKPDSRGFYTVKHSSYAYLIDPQGHLVARFEPPYNPIEVARLFGQLQQPETQG